MPATPAKPKVAKKPPTKKPTPSFANKEQLRQYCRIQFSETPPHVDDLSHVLQHMPVEFIEFILQQKRKEESVGAVASGFAAIHPVPDIGTYTSGLCQAEDPKTEIGKRLNFLDIAANDISCELDHLESRISSVLLPDVPQPVNGVGAQASGPIRSEVEISIDSTLFRLHRSIDRIHEIMGRVQL